MIAYYIGTLPWYLSGRYKVRFYIYNFKPLHNASTITNPYTYKKLKTNKHIKTLNIEILKNGTNKPKRKGLLILRLNEDF